MVEYPKNPAQHQSQVDVAKSYIEKGAEKRADKYKVLDKLDKNTIGEITSNVGQKFKINEYGATSFTDALSRHFYGNSEGYKGLSHEQRNVVLNVYLALASQGLDVNVCRPNDEWKFDLEAGTFEATLDGKKVSGKLEYLDKKEDREKVILETRSALSALKTRITAEAQNVLASEAGSTVERTTEARKAIEIGSLSNLMATLGNMDATGFQERKALLSKELTEGATKDQLVDDTITGINHYLELAGAGTQKINPETGEGYKGTVEQNKAWIKFIKDVLGNGQPDYLKKGDEEVEEAVEPPVVEATEVAKFGFQFIEKGPKPNKGIEERKDLKAFLTKHFEAVSKEVGGMTYGNDVEIIWSEEGGQRSLEVKWKEIKGKDMPRETLMDKSKKVSVDAGGIFHGWGKSWAELVPAMENVMNMPENLTATPADEIWAEKPKAFDDPQPKERERVDETTREGGGGDAIVGIGPLEGMSGGPSGTLPPMTQAELKEPELPPMPKLEITYDPTMADKGEKRIQELLDDKDPEKKSAQEGLQAKIDRVKEGAAERGIDPNEAYRQFAAEYERQESTLTPSRKEIKSGLISNLSDLGISPDYHFEDVTVKGIEFGPAKVKDLAKSEYRFDGFVSGGEHGAGARAVAERNAEEWKGHILVFESKEKVDGRPRVRMEVQSPAYMAYWGAPKIRVWTEGEKELHDYDSDRHDVMGELEKFQKNPD